MSHKDNLFVAALSGFVLALALAFGQLTRPAIIIGWVDVFGDWKPHMMVFFVGASGAYHLFARIHAWKRAQGAADACAVKPMRIDARLLIGATIFGVGWGIAGACPGPALTTLGAGAPWAAVFVGAMAVGLRLADAPRLRGPAKSAESRGPLGKAARPWPIRSEG